jgi:hypothetical protein
MIGEKNKKKDGGETKKKQVVSLNLKSLTDDLTKERKNVIL